MPRDQGGAQTGSATRMGGRGLILAAVCLACGCSVLGPERTVPEVAPASKEAASSAMLSQNLELLQRLVQGTPSDQAEIVAAAQHDFDTTPSPSKKLRLALILATPDHPATDLPRAQRLLRELVAQPEVLVPGERSLAFLTLQQIDDHLTLVAENRRLQNDAHDRERLAIANHHLQQEVEGLTSELKEARARLDAIADIERQLDEHNPRKSPSTVPRKNPSTEGRPQ